MRVSRRIATLTGAALATAALGAAASPAASARTLVQIGGSVSPAITAFTTTPQNLNLTVDVRFASDAPGGDPGTVASATILFPHGPRVNSRLFPSCDPRKLERLRGSRRACPRGSRIGSGSALGTSPQLHGVTEPLRIDVYNGPHGRSVLFYLFGANPISISGMLNAPLQAIRSHQWAYRLTIKVPHSLQEVGPGIFASLLRFTTRVGATVRVHGVRHGYIEVLACPPGALVPVHGAFGFLDRSTADAGGYLACG
jgi:hypothetical protein